LELGRGEQNRIRGGGEGIIDIFFVSSLPTNVFALPRSVIPFMCLEMNTLLHRLPVQNPIIPPPWKRAQ